MANPNSRKGSRLENELVNFFYDHSDFAVMRAPASGASTERELPDVLAGNGDSFYAVEAKSSGSNTIYIDEEEIEALQYFAHNFGAEARIGVRFDVEHGDPAYGDDDNPGWYFFDPEDLYRTDSGNYRVKKEIALESGENFAQLTDQSTQKQAA